MMLDDPQVFGEISGFITVHASDLDLVRINPIKGHRPLNG